MCQRKSNRFEVFCISFLSRPARPLLAQQGSGSWSQGVINLGNPLALDHPVQESGEGGGPLGTYPPSARQCQALAGGSLKRRVAVRPRWRSGARQLGRPASEDPDETGGPQQSATSCISGTDLVALMAALKDNDQ